MEPKYPNFGLKGLEAFSRISLHPLAFLEHSQQRPQTEMSTKPNYRQQLNRYIEHARAGFLVIVTALAAIVIILYGLQP